MSNDNNVCVCVCVCVCGCVCVCVLTSLKCVFANCDSICMFAHAQYELIFLLLNRDNRHLFVVNKSTCSRWNTTCARQVQVCGKNICVRSLVGLLGSVARVSAITHTWQMILRLHNKPTSFTAIYVVAGCQPKYKSNTHTRARIINLFFCNLRACCTCMAE